MPLLLIPPPSSRTHRNGHTHATALYCPALPCTAYPAGITTLNFRGCVPNELEAIFRRGPEWGKGLELVLAAALQVGCGDGVG